MNVSWNCHRQSFQQHQTNIRPLICENPIKPLERSYKQDNILFPAYLAFSFLWCCWVHISNPWLTERTRATDIQKSSAQDQVESHWDARESNAGYVRVWTRFLLHNLTEIHTSIQILGCLINNYYIILRDCSLFKFDNTTLMEHVR